MLAFRYFEDISLFSRLRPYALHTRDPKPRAPNPKSYARVLNAVLRLRPGSSFSNLSNFTLSPSSAVCCQSVSPFSLVFFESCRQYKHLQTTSPCSSHQLLPAFTSRPTLTCLSNNKAWGLGSSKDHVHSLRTTIV